MQHEEEIVNGIEHHNEMCGDSKVEVVKFVQDGEARVNGIEHHNGMCGDTKNEFDALKKEVLLLKKCKDDEFDILTKRFSKLETSQTFMMFKNFLETDMCTENQSTDLNPKNYEDMPKFCSNHNDTSNHIGRLSIEAKASSFSINPGNDKDASHLDDLIEIDGENVKDGYTNSQDHLHLLIKALESKTENHTLDLVVPPKDDDCILCTYKPNDAYDVVEVVNYEDGYMLLLNDEDKPVKSSLNDMESAKDRKKQLAMALKPPFGQQSATTPVPKKENPDYISNGHMYRLPWQAVEKVYFSVNEPKTHWCLVELKIPTGVVSFYDSLGWAGRFRRRWWRRMKKLFPEKLTIYLVMHGILESKGISADDYKITYKYVDAPFQASLFGDCGIRVCIFIYRLCRNLPLTVDDPLETALAYRERMLEYF
nr:ulp1 protease family, C-terminal catalytic domain-containing protein [Tanacetum cinerariifolium]